jgi:GNAT superfamily N-acetyltransferase
MDAIRTFKDKFGREIEVYCDGYEVSALHEGKEIGSFDFDEIEMETDSIVLLVNLGISKEFQRAGIGIQLIEVAEELFDDFHVVSHLSTEGAAFLNYCRTNKILKLQHQLYDDDRF